MKSPPKPSDASLPDDQAASVQKPGTAVVDSTADPGTVVDVVVDVVVVVVVVEEPVGAAVPVGTHVRVTAASSGDWTETDCTQNAVTVAEQAGQGDCGTKSVVALDELAT